MFKPQTKIRCPGYTYYCWGGQVTFEETVQCHCRPMLDGMCYSCGNTRYVRRSVNRICGRCRGVGYIDA